MLKKNKGLHFHQRTRSMKKKLIILSITTIIGLTALIGGGKVLAEKSRKIEIELSAGHFEMLQDEEIPELRVKATMNSKKPVKDLKYIVNEDTNYTVQDLLDSLNKGDGYVVSCRANGKKEGKYPIKLELSSALQEKLEENTDGRVEIHVSNGTLNVKNKLGRWEKNKFKSWDGEYLKERFVVSKGQKYYLDKDGKRVSGWLELDTYRYYFNEKGVMQTGWHKQEDGTYFLNEDGVMFVGWKEVGKKKYYFDHDGKMLTGKKKVGIKECVFGEDGVLQSEKMLLNPDKPMIALTFDDGPGPRTDELLAQLEKHNAKATFFVVKGNAKKYKKELKKMREIGCEIGNHSSTHPQLTKLSPEEIKEEMAGTNNVIADATGYAATVMRPPYGAINDKVKENVELPLILWNRDTLDWKTKNTSATINYVMNTARDGDVILMHDIHGATIDAAIKLIPKLQDQGFQLVTVTELAEAKGVILENDERYAQFK